MRAHPSRGVSTRSAPTRAAKQAKNKSNRVHAEWGPYPPPGEPGWQRYRTAPANGHHCETMRIDEPTAHAGCSMPRADSAAAGLPDPASHTRTIHPDPARAYSRCDRPIARSNLARSWHIRTGTPASRIQPYRSSPHGRGGCASSSAAEIAPAQPLLAAERAPHRAAEGRVERTPPPPPHVPEQEVDPPAFPVGAGEVLGATVGTAATSTLYAHQSGGPSVPVSE